jgi:Zn-dependent peptidase ImmA (M78 family)/DNA-binding XRE family transcriptional regulator
MPLDFDPHILGARLREARKATGMKQQDVATRLGMARTTLVAIEKGERRVTAEELVQLAAAYQRNLNELVSRPYVVTGFVPQFRSTAQDEAEAEPAARELEARAEDYVELERLNGTTTARTFPPEYNVTGITIDQAAEEIATAERNRLGLGDGPISNLRELLENDIGIRAFYYPMQGRVAGLFAYNQVLGPCMGINSKHPFERQSWTLAHEYAHFLTSRYEPELTILTVERRGTGRERMADGFAKYFLMPTTGLSRRLTELARNERITLAHVCIIAAQYRVSVQAMTLRLEELRRIPTGTWERLITKGFKVHEAQTALGIAVAVPIAPQFPKRYIALALRAHQRGDLSEGQLARYLHTDRITARMILEEFTSHMDEEGGVRSFIANLDEPLDAQ